MYRVQRMHREAPGHGAAPRVGERISGAEFTPRCALLRPRRTTEFAVFSSHGSQDPCTGYCFF
jgi:hypothetical protein